jgi:hypothetical protein
MAGNISRDAVTCVRIAFLAACTAVLAAEVIALAGYAPGPHRFLSVDSNAYHPFFSYAMGGLFAIHALTWPSTREVARASLTGFLLLAIHSVLFALDTGQAHRLVGLVLYYQGLGSLAFLATRAWRLRAAPEGMQALLLLMAGSTLPLFVIASRPLLVLSSTANPATLDLLAFAFDRSLGFDPSAAVARFVLDSAISRELALTIYAALPLLVAVAFAMQLRQRDRTPDSLLVFMAIALTGFPIYFLYPVAGPIFAFGSMFPGHLPALPGAVDVLPGAPRNGMPSLHFAWALALSFHARNAGFQARLAYGAFLWLTALAILGLGEHYLVDLVVALPLVLVALAACAPARSIYRRRALAAGLTMLGAWLAWLTWGAALFASVGRAHWIPMTLTLWLVIRFGGRLARPDKPVKPVRPSYFDRRPVKLVR